MAKWKQLFSNSKSFIGMIHVQALPGTPKNMYSMSQIIEMACTEALTLVDYGFDGVILENMHDVPYLKVNVGYEIIAAMTSVACAIRRKISIPIGIQILAGANHAALSVALAANLDFIRAEGYVFGHIGDEGYHDSCAGSLLRYRKYISAEHIAILTDIKKKHSAHSITADVSIEETARSAEFFLSDGLIITGSSTSVAPDINDIKKIKDISTIPLILGSGLTASNLHLYYSIADGFIVGSFLKEEGIWSNKLCPLRIKSFIDEKRRLQEH